MATAKTKKTQTTAKTKTAEKEAPAVVAEEQPAVIEETVAAKEEAPTPAEKKAKIKARTFQPTDYVTVRNGTQGVLVYKNTHTGETFIWNNFGDEQEIELRELKNAKSASKSFFINNWFLFDDPTVVDYLGVSQYYKYALNTDDFNDLFNKTPEEVAEILPNLSDGQKKSVAYRAYQLIKDGTIDSVKMIKVLQEGLNVRLTDAAIE